MITEKIRPQAGETQVGFVLVGAAVAELRCCSIDSR